MLIEMLSHSPLLKLLRSRIEIRNEFSLKYFALILSSPPFNVGSLRIPSTRAQAKLKTFPYKFIKPPLSGGTMMVPYPQDS